MKRVLGIGTVVIASVLATSAFALPDRVGDFGLLDSDGDFHQLSRYRNKEALVLMSFDSSCAAINSSVSSLEAMASEWNEQGIAFALINSSSESNIETIRAAKSALGSDLPLLLDDG
ncbi:MAG: redoxin domain-containing protein, partial [Gammaproteobacteria bacterium]|nr:redoxin domain-containing protein [Gammaproteobacteria bacterium]